MVGEHISRAAERAWKHRFAQILYEHFCFGGLAQAAALADAYAHADAQYLVRGLGSPEDEARSALTWIQADLVPATTDSTSNERIGDGPHPVTPHNGAPYIKTSPFSLLGVDLSE